MSEKRTSRPFDPHELVLNMHSALLYLESRIDDFDPVNCVTDRAQYVLLPDYLRRAIAEIKELRDRVHSEQFVVMFLGFLCAKLPELRSIESPRLLDAWDEFKREMGKKT